MARSLPSTRRRAAAVADDSGRPRPSHPLAWLGALVAVLLLSACAQSQGPQLDPASVSPPADPAVNPYDPGFAFRQPIPADARTAARSGAIVARLVDNASRSRVQLAYRAEVPTIYEVEPGDPELRVDVTGVETTFRVPDHARQGDGSDAPMVLLDPDHPTLGPEVELRLWRASIDRDAGRLRGQGAGLYHYNNDGRRLDPNDRPSLSIPFAGRGTGSGLSIMAGLIRPEEVERGAIHHALRMTYSRADFLPIFRAPATKTDQPLNTTTRDPASAMIMGMRLQLDPAVDCNRRTVPGESNDSPQTRLLRMICFALQDYGAIVSDGTSIDGMLIQMEHDATAGWSEVIGEPRFDSYGYLIRERGSADDGLERDDRSGIPWSRMRVLERSVFTTTAPATEAP